MTNTDLVQLNSFARSKFNMGTADVRDALAEAGLDIQRLKSLDFGEAQIACKKYAGKYHTLYRELSPARQSQSRG